jgi:C-terminal processing protease CtpA/Prc
MVFIALMAFLSSCEKMLALKEPSTDAAPVFEEAWQRIDEGYSLFGVKDVDWVQTRATFAAQLPANATDQVLFQVTGDMLKTLKDGHVALISPTDTSAYDGYYRNYRRNFNWRNIENNYLKGSYATSGPVVYKIVNGVGYLYCGSFESPVTEAQMDEVFLALSTTNGLIVDVRNNGGGNVENARSLLRHFLRAPSIIQYEQYKKGKGHDEFYPPSPVTIASATDPYRKPVVVLTNRVCFSACNDFVSAMKTLPDVSIYGDSTGGGGAVPREYLLANGWKLRCSSSVTLDAGQHPIEKGIAPTRFMTISQIEEDQGKDPIIDSAYARLK